MWYCIAAIKYRKGGDAVAKQDTYNDVRSVFNRLSRQKTVREWIQRFKDDASAQISDITAWKRDNAEWAYRSFVVGQHPANALKTLVHRTRAVLDDMIPDGGRLIAGSHSSYAFIESNECVIDSSLFKEYINKAEDESLSRTRRISM